MVSKTIWVKGTSGNTVTIDIYDTDGSALVTGGAMSEAGSTGMFYYNYTITMANAHKTFGALITDDTSGRSMGIKEISIAGEVALKIAKNRWKIENNQLKVYDDDESTVLFTYDLKNKNGAASSQDIFERDPV